MSLPSLEQIRADVAARLFAHLVERRIGEPHDPLLFVALKTAVADWHVSRLLVLYVMSNDANRWWTQRAVAKATGLSLTTVTCVWRRLARIVLRQSDGTDLYLFRRDVEMSFRHSGTLDGELVVGGICLHLSQQAPRTTSHNSSITETTQPALDSLATNASAAHARNAALSVEQPASKQRTQQRKPSIAAKVAGPQLGLAGTGTSGT